MKLEWNKIELVKIQKWQEAVIPHSTEVKETEFTPPSNDRAEYEPRQVSYQMFASISTQGF